MRKLRFHAGGLAILEGAMPDLTVEVHDRIIVAQPSVGLSITYRKEAYAPMLVAVNDMRRDPTPEELRFLPRA